MQLAESPQMVHQLLEAVQLPNFDIATDAFSSCARSILRCTVSTELLWNLAATMDLLGTWSCQRWTRCRYKELMTLHKTRQWAQWMDVNYEVTFAAFSKLHSCPNYVTRRLSLKLLAEVLMDRNNFKAMSRYIADVGNLKQVMMALVRVTQSSDGSIDNSAWTAELARSRDIGGS
jgi:hypothetical protein